MRISDWSSDVCSSDLLEEREMLEHHADAEGARGMGIGNLDSLPVPPQRAGVRVQNAVDDLHKGRLAGAVLAAQGRDLAGRHRELDAVVGERDGKALADAACF